MSTERVIGQPRQISSEDVVVIPAGQTSILQQCCDCGLVHHIKILNDHAGLRLQFVNLGHGPDLTSFALDTQVETPRPEA